MEKNFDEKELKKKKIPELKTILNQSNLKVSGNKPELIDRISINESQFPLINLHADVLRETALKLPIKDIFNLCETNKRFQKQICNYDPFWEALFLRKIPEKIEIPENAPIAWYKDKIKNWPAVKTLADLIREEKVGLTYISKIDPNWSSFEMVENLKNLSCWSKNLTSLPPMPNLEILRCSDNQFTSLPPMPNLKELACNGNKLTTLPPMLKLRWIECSDNRLISLPPMPNLTDLFCGNNKLTTLLPMPNLERLYCYNNQLTIIPPMPNLHELYCYNNNLTTLPPMPNLGALYCDDNPLPFFTLGEWKQHWKNRS